MNQDILSEAINLVGNITSNEEYISDRYLQIFVKEINDLKANIQSLERLQVIVIPIEIAVKSETETKSSSPKGNDRSPVQYAKVKSHFKKHINGPWKPEARNRTRSSFNACLGYQQLC